MLINPSKFSTARHCWRHAFNRHVRGFSFENLGMTSGTAMHLGIATGMVTKNWEKAILVAEEKFEKEKEKLVTLPGEEWIAEDQWKITAQCIRTYAEHFATENYTVLMPECRFSVPLPDSSHNDVTTHWMERVSSVGWEEHWSYLHWAKRDSDHNIIYPIETPFGPKDSLGDKMTAESVLERRICSPHSGHNPMCPCYLPHLLNGITDNVVRWGQAVWLMDHKMTSRGGDLFFEGFKLDVQPTAYLYGIWKSTGLLPSGVIINALVKPSMREVEQWNSKRKYGPPKDIADYVKFEREPIVRTKEDLSRFEKEVIEFGDEWEERLVNGRWPHAISKDVCVGKWKCDFFQLCLSHDDPTELGTLEEKRLIRIGGVK